MGKHGFAEKLHLKLKCFLMRPEHVQHFAMLTLRNISIAVSELEKKIPYCAGSMGHPCKKSLFDNNNYAFQAPILRTDVPWNQHTRASWFFPPLHAFGTDSVIWHRA
jgi:hypothetical protein